MAPKVREFIVLQEDSTFQTYLQYLKAIKDVYYEMLLRHPDVNRTDLSNYYRGKIDVITEILELPEKFEKEVIKKEKEDEDEQKKGKGD